MERLSTATLMAVPMYLQHGFCVIGTGAALASSGALRFMMKRERWTLAELCEAQGLSGGYARSCVHALVSLDLVVEDGGDKFRAGRDFGDFCRLPFDAIEAYLAFDFATVFERDDAAFLARIRLEGGPKQPRIALLLEAFFLAPLVIYARMHVSGTSDAFTTTHLRLAECAALGPAVAAIFAGLGWCDAATAKLTYRARSTSASSSTCATASSSASSTTRTSTSSRPRSRTWAAATAASC